MMVVEPLCALQSTRSIALPMLVMGMAIWTDQ